MKWFSFLTILAIVALNGCDQGARVSEQAKKEKRKAVAANKRAAKPAKKRPVAHAPAVKPHPDVPEPPAPMPKPSLREKKNATTGPSVEPRRRVEKPKRAHITPRRSRDDDQWATEADLQGIREKAGPGMGKKGHGYGNDIVTYPVATYFRVRERIGIELIKKNMQLYQATRGHYPRTQDEFRKEIIKKNHITLPVLPDGHKFYYDPDKHELFVVKPPRGG
jgi:hypothetical protein